MNLKLVLRTYSALRQLTDNESALLNTLRAMNDSERELLVESLSPEKSTTSHRGASKSNRQASKSSSKSSRASGMAAAINRSLGQQRQAAKDGDNDSNALHDPECQFVLNDDTGETCGAMKNDPIHDMRYLSSHEFASGGTVTSTRNTEDEKASASVAAGGLGE